MSNAILIIDMPKDCPQCPVAHYNKLDEFTGCDIVGGKRYAITTEKGYKDTNYRPNWCPLMSLSRETLYEIIYQAYGLGADERYKKLRDTIEEIIYGE